MGEVTIMPKKEMAEVVATWLDPALDVLRGSAGRQRTIARLREIIRLDYSIREEVIKDAEGGSLLCHEALEGEFNAMLDLKPEQLPASLRTYMMRKDRHPKRRAGKQADEFDQKERNIAFMILMSAACTQFGLDLNHNPANDRPCATEVVSAALELKGIEVSPKRLSAIATKELKWLRAAGWWEGA
jgi:hypothetical protein